MQNSHLDYFSLEGIAPVLNLMTADGALLDTDDPLSIVLNENEVCASITSWNLAPLVDRYKEACSASNTGTKLPTKTALLINETRVNFKSLFCSC